MTVPATTKCEEAPDGAVDDVNAEDAKDENQNDENQNAADQNDSDQNDADAKGEDGNDELPVADPSDTAQTEDPASAPPSRPRRWPRILFLGVFPALTMIFALVAGYLKWVDSSAETANSARVESVAAARDGAVAMLSYKPATVDKDLAAARVRLTGSLQDSYGSLINDVVIPGSRQRQIAAAATVPAAAAVSASGNHAVVLMFVDQTITVGSDPPTSTASRVRVTLDKVGDRWLIAGFDPI